MEEIQRLGEIKSYERVQSPNNWGESYGECDAPPNFTFLSGVAFGLTTQTPIKTAHRMMNIARLQ